MLFHTHLSIILHVPFPSVQVVHTSFILASCMFISRYNSSFRTLHVPQLSHEITNIETRNTFQTQDATPSHCLPHLSANFFSRN